MKMRKVFSFLLAICLTAGAMFLQLPQAEAQTVTPVQAPMYGRSQLAKMPKASALLYAYDQIVEGVENCSNNISVYDGTTYLTVGELVTVWDTYTRDYAHHFWIGNSYDYYSIGSNATSIVPTYLMTGTALETARAKFEAEAAEILSGISASMSDYEKELYLHDELASRIVYAESTNAHNAYGALVDGVAVCEGYAEALQYLLHQVDIPSFLITGSSNDPATGTPVGHKWNAVQIDGKWYQVDLTWDDQGDELYHAYFNLTTARLQEDHLIESASVALPVCNSEDAFYFTGEDTLLETYDVATVGKLLKDNGYHVHVYVPGDVNAFVNWYNNNIGTLASQAGIPYYMGFSYSYATLGREVCLELIPVCSHTNKTETAAKAATCEDPGNNKYYTCNECHTVLKADGTTKTSVEAEKLPALGHTYENNICTSCGQVDPAVLGTQEYPEILIPGNERTVELAGEGSYYFQWTAPEDGVLTMDISVFRTLIFASSNGLDHDNQDTADKSYVTEISPSSDIVVWEVAQGETVSIEVQNFVSYFGTGNIEINFEAREHSEGSNAKPIVIVDQNTDTVPVAEFTVTIPAGKTYWFDITNVKNSYMKAEAADGIRYMTYNYEWDADEEGVVSILIEMRSGSLQIENTTDADYTANLRFEYELGWQKNPMPLELGDTQLVWAIPDNYGRYYTWTAPSDGTFTFHIAGESEYNLWQYQISSRDKTGGLHTAEDVPCVDTETWEVKAGDQLTIFVISYGYAPDLIVGFAGAFNITASFEEAECAHAETTILDAVAPSCTEEGLTEGKKCAICGEILTEQKIIPALGHSFEGIKCIECGLNGGYCGAATNEGGEESVVWTLVDGVLTISGSGKMADFGYADAPWYSIAAQIEKVIIQPGITNIGNHAFFGCSNLSNVSIPDSVTVIGNSAFNNCTKLASIALPDGVTTVGSYAFTYCRALKSLDIPEDTTSIGEFAFYHCTALSTLQIPENVESIGRAAFFGCSNLTGIWVAEENAYFSSDAYGVLFNKAKTTLLKVPGQLSGSYSIPESVTCIEESAFFHCYNLTSVTIPDKVTEIKRDAFNNCTGLTGITLPSGITEIAESTFSNCTKLKSITIPDGVTGIGEYAFNGCDNLREITVPVSVTTIELYAFNSCGKLSDVYYGGTEAQWEEVTIGEHNYDLEDATIHFTDPCAGGHSYTSVITDPTCTAQGYTTYTCTVCGDSYKDNFVDPEEHDYETAVTHPGCTSQGYTTYTCADCGYSYKADYKEETGHTAEPIPGVEPGCTSTGLTEGSKCAVCGDILTSQEIIPALDHTPVTIPGYAATCSAPGLTDGSKCDTCGDILAAQEEIPVLDHVAEVVPGYAATCTAPGKTDGSKCSACGTTLAAQEEIPVLDHVPETVTGYAATCTAPGKTDGSKCSACGTTLTAQEEIPMLDHDMQETEAAVTPGCETYGKTAVLTCSMCGKTEGGISVDPTGHDWTDGTCTNCSTACEHSYDMDGVCTVCGSGCVHDYEAETTDPTCTEQGYTTYTCKVCEYSYKGDYKDPLDHSWQDATCTEAKKCIRCGITDGDPKGHNYTTEVTAPTCTAQGYTTHTCTGCGDVIVDNYTPVTEHTAGVPVEKNRVEATCTQDGSYDSVTCCTGCGTELSSVPGVIPTKGHSNEDALTAPNCTEQGYTTHTCTVCGDVTVDNYTPATGHTPAGEPVIENKTEDGWDEVVYCTVCEEELSRKHIGGGLLGDANGDGEVDNIDAMLIARYDVGLTAANKIHLEACDINGDGEVDNIDAMLVARYDVGFTSKYPIGQEGKD